MIFTLKNFKEEEKKTKYVQKNVFNTKEGAGIFYIFTSEGKKRRALPTLRVNLQCSKGWYLYLYLVQSREFWPRIFFSLCFYCSAYIPVLEETEQPPAIVFPVTGLYPAQSKLLEKSRLNASFQY